MQTTKSKPPVYATAREISDLTGISESYLAQLRCAGKGPRYFKPGGMRRVLYSPDDVREWIEAGARRTASNAA